MVEPCDDISDFELIRRMADQENDFAGARIAWGLFYRRHQAFLLGVCRSDYVYLLDVDGVSDLVQDVFMRVFNSSSTFNHAEVCGNEIQRRKCRRWMARIAENLVRDRHKAQEGVHLVDDEQGETLIAVQNEDISEVGAPESERLKLLKSGLALLSEVEQTILRATMFWWQADQQHQRMPHAAMEQLSKQLAKSPENIRQIRSRALKKLEKHVNENLNNEKAE
jgi:RNA polymerase sigma factor (sigma-70 family)